MEATLTIETPNFSIDKLPKIRIKSIQIENFKVFEDVKFDFSERNFACFIGPNGTGKSTVMEIIQLLFSRFEGYEESRLKAYLGRSVRNVNGKMDGVYFEDDFLITATIECDGELIEIKLNKNGFINDHPSKLKPLLYRICYLSSFDKELNKFQLIREQWPKFKALFESVTGYEIEETTSVMEIGSDDVINKLLAKYILGFNVKKPHETIFYRECSDGERKVIKSFSTLLNMEWTPPIILIDNIEMHIELKRHVPLINALKRCFPDSQIFSTTHSIRIAKNINFHNDIYDLRMVYASDLIKREPWRLYLSDEIDDFMAKAEGLVGSKMTSTFIEEGERLQKKLMEGIENKDVILQVKKFTRDVEEQFVNDMVGLTRTQKIND